MKIIHALWYCDNWWCQYQYQYQYQGLRGLRRGSAIARMPIMWVRIPPEE